MKILCIIDHLGSGGAQRQMAILCRGLIDRGHSVDLFVYYPEYLFFHNFIDGTGVTLHAYSKSENSSFGVIRALVDLMSERCFDGVISFLQTPNFYAEMAAFLARPRRLIVSERNNFQNDRYWLMAFLQRVLHLAADRVVANNHEHAKWLRRYPWLKNKVQVIYNGVSIRGLVEFHAPSVIEKMRLIAIGRVTKQKNLATLIHALDIIAGRYGQCPMLSWVGRRDQTGKDLEYIAEMDAMLAAHPSVAARWNWLGERSDIENLLAKHHALILPSLFEGLPNVVCEALAMGRPVLASRVCDHPRLVEEGKRGFLFDPLDAENMANAIIRLSEQNADQWTRMSEQAHRYAAENLSVQKMIDAFEGLLCD